MFKKLPKENGKLKHPENGLVRELRRFGLSVARIADYLDKLTDPLGHEYKAMDKARELSDAYFAKYGGDPNGNPREKSAKEMEYETMLARQRDQNLSAEACAEQIKAFHERWS